MRLLAGSAAVLVLTFATACGGGGGNFPSAVNPGDTTAGGATPAPQVSTGAAGGTTCTAGAGTGGSTISMEGTHSLNPSDITIKVGDALTFTNNSSTNHQIVFDGGPNCGFTLIGKSVNVQFASAGSYHYVCKIHPTFMTGTVTVQ
jgi:plastocyanin